MGLSEGCQLYPLCVVLHPSPHPLTPHPPLILPFRFHILSSYILSGVDDLSVYDPAINHEHLMKCIQSLIETYRELRLQVSYHQPSLSPLDLTTATFTRLDHWCIPTTGPYLPLVRTHHWSVPTTGPYPPLVCTHHIFAVLFPLCRVSTAIMKGRSVAMTSSSISPVVTC